MSSNRNLQKQSKWEIRKAFIPTIEILHKSLGNKAFRFENRFVPTIFELVTITIARKLAQSEINNLEELKSWYELLVEDREFRSVSMKIRNLTSKENFQKRIEIASKLQIVRYLISTITACSKPVLKRICSHQHQSKFN
ncbi:MAG: hypothetical protein GDA43_21365 [Hormoscilla sp. SP5CHS1]|nr:hypothetical protein [Hormoscilla sp. SP5CHS1]